MPWIELSIDTTREAIDWVCTLLGSVDYAGTVQMMEYPPSEDAQGWPLQVCLYLPAQTSRMQLEKIVDLLSPLQRTQLISAPQIAQVEHKPDPVTPAHSLTRRIGQRFVVLPAAGADQPEAGQIPLRLATSFAFGSGLHPATVLALELLEKYVLPEMQVLDLGSGTGILSVAMAKLGAQVLALDNDQIAVQATQATVCHNQSESQVTVRLGSLGQGSHLGHWMGGDLPNAVPAVQPESSFDLIVANILARVHLTLVADYQHALRRSAKAGFLITGGYTTDYESEVDAALTSAGFKLVEPARSQEWVALVHQLA